MPNVFNIWMRLLKNVKNSVLWLIKDNPTAVLNLKNEAKLKNINPDRIIFAEITSLPVHLARHKFADLTKNYANKWVGGPIQNSKGIQWVKDMLRLKKAGLTK